MFCPNCGHDNLDTAAHCAACGTALNAAAAPPPPPAPGYGPPPQSGYPYGAAPTGPAPPNHLVFAIIATVVATICSMLTCCCIPLGLPTGIVAIVFANKVNNLHAIGDANGALDASAKAKLWSWITTGLAIVFAILLIISIIMNVMGYNNDFMEEFRRELERQGG